VGNYTEIYQHFVWATKRRAPYIVPEVEPLLHDYIRTKCTELKVIVHAVNSMPDHLHLACSLPMTITPSFFLEQIKGGSAHFINHHPRLRSKMEICLYWQSGCGLLTFAKRELPRIISYVDHQKQHHAAATLFEKMERCDDGYGHSDEKETRP
jgi:putative transposase